MREIECGCRVCTTLSDFQISIYILIYSIFHSLSCWVAYFLCCSLILFALFCPALLSKSEEDEEKKINIMFVIEIVAQFSLKNHLTYAAYTAFFWWLLLLLVRVTSLSLYHSLTHSLTMCMCVCICVPVCLRPWYCLLLFPSILFFTALLAQSLASNRKRTKLFFCTFSSISRSTVFFFVFDFSLFFFNLMVNEALVYKQTHTHKHTEKNINSIHSSI